jgi:hypothetical protein
MAATATYQLNDDASMPPGVPRAEQLEAELGEMRKAFEEYIATTQDLEINLDMELSDMRKFIMGAACNISSSHHQ